MTRWTPEQIQTLRQQLGETVAEFGRRFHRSGRTVEDWEQGRHTPDPLAQDALDALARRTKKKIARPPESS